MTEGVSTNISYAKSAEERQQMLAEWRKKLTQDDQTNQRLKYMTREQEAKKSPFLSNAEMKERESRFLSNADIAERQTPFVTEDMLPERQTEPFMTRDITAEREATFLEISTGTESPLQLQNIEKTLMKGQTST